MFFFKELDPIKRGEETNKSYKTNKGRKKERAKGSPFSSLKIKINRKPTPLEAVLGIQNTDNSTKKQQQTTRKHYNILYIK